MPEREASMPQLPPLFEPVHIARTRDLAQDTVERARAGAPEGTLVWTAFQEQGRGRFGRRWESPARGLYAGLILRPEFEWRDAGQVALVGLVALGTAAASLVAPLTELRYRWPNTLLVGGTRIAGLWLVEDRAAGWLALSLSCNVETRPQEIFDGGCLLEEGGSPEITPERLLEEFARQFLAWLNLWADEGMAPILRELQHRSDQPGTPIALVIDKSEKMAGAFTGFDSRGRLQLEVDGKRRTVSIRRFLGLSRTASDEA